MGVKLIWRRGLSVFTRYVMMDKERKERKEQEKRAYCEAISETVYKRCLLDIYINPYRFLPIPRDPIMMPIVPELYCLQDLHDTYMTCMQRSGSKGAQ
jgi:hypothetical protein